MGFSIIGTIIAVVILLPSIIFFIKFPPRHAAEEKSKLPKIFELLEKIGQMGCIVSLVISKDFFLIEKANYFTMLMVICIALYYALWIAYAIKDGEFSVMLKPLLFIPIPGAVLPVCAFVFAALWGQCIWLGASAIILAVGHCTISWESYRRIK
ncbi:hypothetical protein SAMN04488542_11185 [Fontibacillus panacisegetis]|uniref:Uncharacterized protein n=1 Tax=Fontibacillus panacisegetis TaxID=670482 RepID=A0A1G7LDC0_9BACL|nr:hypothetical protein [Fontibacillus panacisegetis]SDF47463.1 hypothetical protein SAMN04488542_11185 [Fontibacillus panacisegetis]